MKFIISNTHNYVKILGPGKYDLHKMNSGPKITIARRDKTFDQKCNSNPGKYYRNLPSRRPL